MTKLRSIGHNIADSLAGERVSQTWVNRSTLDGEHLSLPYEPDLRSSVGSRPALHRLNECGTKCAL